jgi:hypothetical protein
VGQDVRPSVPTQHEEHQDKDQSQEIDVDSSDTLESVVALKHGHGVEDHANALGFNCLRNSGGVKKSASTCSDPPRRAHALSPLGDVHTLKKEP